MDKEKNAARLSDDSLDRITGGTGYAYYCDSGDTRRIISSEQPMDAQQIRDAFQDKDHGGCVYSEAPLDAQIFPTAWEMVQQSLDKYYDGDVHYQECKL